MNKNLHCTEPIKYYDIVSSEKSLDLLIKWNVSALSGSHAANGIVLQHVNINSHLSCVPNRDYWELWEVTNGKILKSQYEYDDKFSALPSFLIEWYKDEINASSDGIVNFKTEVYWISLNNDIYNEIITWKPNAVSEAGELKSSYTLNGNPEPYLRFKRFYKINYKEILEKSTKKEGDKICDTK